MIEVRRLRVLRELADRGTVAAAARALHLTPSAVSQQLATLARETGVRVVEPDGRGLRLTDGGRLLLGHAHQVFAQLEQAEADLARHRAGHRATVRVGAIPTALAYLVAPAAMALRDADPPVDVHTTEAAEPDSVARVGDGELDVAVSVEYDGAPQAGNPRFHREPLLADPLAAALPAGHPLAGATRLDLPQLAAEPWVLGLPGTSCYEIVRVACAAAGFTPTAAHRTSDWAAVGAVVAAGAGVALIPRLAHPLVPPTVHLVPLRQGLAARHLFVATRRGSQTTPAIAATLRALHATADHLSAEDA